MRSFRPKPLFRKKQKLPDGNFRLKPGNASPSKPIKGAPPLPFTDEMAAEASKHFAKAKLQDMRRKLMEE